MARVVIVGAGLSGLTVAFRLRQRLPDIELTVLEGRSRAGGNIWTEYRDGYRVETGPNGFLDTKFSTIQLCRDLGLGDRLIQGSEGARKNRYLLLNERLQKLPTSPLGIFTTSLLSLGGKLTLLKEPFRRRPQNLPADESVAAFARRRFGQEVADVFIDAIVTGIHAGDPEKLSLRAAFPRLAKFEAEAGSIFRGFLQSAKLRKTEQLSRGDKPSSPRMWSFREGLRVLIEGLQEKIGTPITTGVAVKRLEQRPHSKWVVRGEGQDSWEADAVVMTCPAYAQSAAVAELDAQLAEDYAAIPHNRIAVAVLGYRVADVPVHYDGFGYIAPQHTRRPVLGVQWCTSIYPDRAPPGFVLWRVLCGGTSRPDVFEQDDETLVRTCHAEMKLVMGVRGEPAFRQVVRWPRAIPQYNLGHLERVERIEAAIARYPGLFTTGNALHGIAMGDVTEQADRIAERVTGFLNDARRNHTTG